MAAVVRALKLAKSPEAQAKVSEEVAKLLALKKELVELTVRLRAEK
jgi:hypothetical protein